MSVKLTVVYENPKDPSAFEAHYRAVHMPLAAKIPHVDRVELAKVFPKEDGTPTPAYRVADLYFADYKTACAALATPEAQAVVADAMTIATGGIKFLLCELE
ncbi:MAG: EthD family reductase [Vulcanimicrobiaceae bacterium]